jgi:NADH dehydrogenase (ubiquinone) Fe-S protein 3
MIQKELNNKYKGIISFIYYQNINKENIITITKKNLLFNFYILKKHFFFQYKLLTCISGVDLLGKTYRFSLCYELLSLQYNTRLRLKLFINEITAISTITSIYINSN